MTAVFGATMSVIRGDCIDVLQTLAAESIDACVTDPPYGIGFMGKEWDTFKPGTGATRKLMHPREREAAKLVSDNPNIRGRHRSPALSPSQIDYDYSLKGLRGFQAWTEGWAREVFRVLKPGAHIVVCGAPRAYHRMASGLEDAGFEIRDCLAWLFGSGFPKSLNLEGGLGTALKPAHEPIALARKSFKGTVKANVEKHGTGALNIDACRIGTDAIITNHTRFGGGDDWSQNTYHGDTSEHFGRWPANVVIDDLAALAIDEQSGDLQPATSRTDTDSRNEYFARGGNAGTVYQDSGGASRFYYCAKPSREERDRGLEGMPRKTTTQTVNRRADSAGVQNPRAGSGRGAGAPIYRCATCGTNLQGGRAVTPCRDGAEHDPIVVGYGEGVLNFHPTVKPVALMRWLVRLVTPPNGTVIDPFLGSGTTGMAAREEQRKFVGIEREAEYVEIAERRIASAASLFDYLYDAEETR